MGREGFGKPGYDAKKTYIKDIKLKAPDENKGESITHFIGRIVPPMFSLKDKPEGWSVFTKDHYGARGSGFKPGTTVAKTHACVEVSDFKTKEIKEPCPKCNDIYKHKAERDRLQKLIVDAGFFTTDKEGNKRHDADAFYKKEPDRAKPVLEALKAENDWLWDNSLSMGNKMYVVTPEDEIVRLMISGKALKGLRAFLKDLQTTQGVDALDIDNGVFIDFMRTGFGNSTQDSFAVASKITDIPGVGKVPVPMKAPLSDAMIDRIFRECTDLAYVQTVLTAEQIQMLVDCDGSPEEVDRIFEMAVKNKKTAAPTGRPEGGEDEGEKKQPEKQPETQKQPDPAVPSNPQPVSQPPVDQAALQAQIEALQAQLAAQKAQPQTPNPETPNPETPTSNPLKKSNDDFFKQFPAAGTAK